MPGGGSRTHAILPRDYSGKLNHRRLFETLAISVSSDMSGDETIWFEHLASQGGRLTCAALQSSDTRGTRKDESKDTRRYIDVYVKTGKGWKAVSEQITRTRR